MARVGEYCACSWWFRGRVWLGKCLQDTEEGWLYCQHRPEPDNNVEDDVAATKSILADQDGPAILVGHSYGGAVITEAGNDPKVAGLVYITAFAPGKGESVATLIRGSASRRSFSADIAAS